MEDPPGALTRISTCNLGKDLLNSFLDRWVWVTISGEEYLKSCGKLEGIKLVQFLSHESLNFRSLL